MSDLLQQWLRGGRLLDWVLGAMLLEALLLLWLRRRSSGATRLGLGLNLAAGAALMFAVRGALVQGGGVAVALPLVVALLAHLGDLWARWRD